MSAEIKSALHILALNKIIQIREERELQLSPLDDAQRIAYARAIVEDARVALKAQWGSVPPWDVLIDEVVDDIVKWMEL